ncbi:MAG: family channel protein [Nocardioides sp.]|nr:family channel protein [Nocardioides sp.]
MADTADVSTTTVTTTGHKVAAEVLGTFVLVFFGCGAALMSGGDYVATGLTFGLTVLVMAYAVGRISGAHFNPAVTVGAAMGGRLAWTQVPVYVGAQLAGAVGAGGVLWILMHGYDGFDSKGNFAQNSFGNDGTGYAWWAALLLEMLLTGVFILVILAVTDERNEHPAMAPLAIGLALAMIHFASMSATGTSVNPARSIGVGLFAGTDAIIQLWLFILAPLIGGSVAGFAYPLIFGRGSEPIPGSGLDFARPAPAAVPGYGAPDQYQQQWNQQDPAVQSAQAHAQAPAEPIIQDGWMWDAAAQQWVPAPQPAAPAPPAAQPDPGAPQQDAGTDQQPTQQYQPPGQQ